MYTRWSPELTTLLNPANGTQSVRIGNLRYHVLPCDLQNDLLQIASTLDDVIEVGIFQIHSTTTNAHIFNVG